VTHDVTVQNRSPVAGFTDSGLDVLTGEEIALYDGGYDNDGNLVTWAWEFGDGATSNARNTTHSYARSGTYTIKLTEWDDQGAGAIATKDVVVHNRPPAGAITIAPLAPVAGQPVTLGASATDPDGTIAGYAWTFGAAGSSTQAAPQVTFPAAGSYAVKVTITDDEGAATTLETAVTVAAAPVTNPDEGGQQGTDEQTPVAPVIVTPAITPLTTPVTAKPVKKPRCKKKVRYVVKKIHGKRKKVKKVVCVKPAKRRR
jgi:chitodextrinase